MEAITILEQGEGPHCRKAGEEEEDRRVWGQEPGPKLLTLPLPALEIKLVLLTRAERILNHCIEHVTILQRLHQIINKGYVNICHALESPMASFLAYSIFGRNSGHTCGKNMHFV